MEIGQQELLCSTCPQAFSLWVTDILNQSFLQMDHFCSKAPTAPVSQVFVTQKNSITRGSDLRVVAAPAIRMLNTTISTESQQQNYLKFYLPVLSKGNNLYLSQSMTQTGTSIFKDSPDWNHSSKSNCFYSTRSSSIGLRFGGSKVAKVSSDSKAKHYLSIYSVVFSINTWNFTSQTLRCQ